MPFGAFLHFGRFCLSFSFFEQPSATDFQAGWRDDDKKVLFIRGGGWYNQIRIGKRG